MSIVREHSRNGHRGFGIDGEMIMKKNGIFRFLMVLSIVLQAGLGVGLSAFGIYADINYYTQIEGFFLHFMFVPGVILLLCLLHFLIFKNYDRKFGFVTTSGYIAFVVSVTGEILVLFYNMFPAGFLGYVLWLGLAAGATALVVMGLNLLYVIAYMALERSRADFEEM